MLKNNKITYIQFLLYFINLNNLKCNNTFLISENTVKQLK